jgi:serine/threonine protein kinase
LEYLHISGVIHGDLRGVCTLSTLGCAIYADFSFLGAESNILISDDHEACIADFGLSKYLDQSPTSTVNRGNIRWLAPELLDQEFPRGDLTPYNEATDIYSLAMTTIEIYTSSSPFHHLRYDANVEVALSDEGRPSRPEAGEVSDGIDDFVWDIIQECWAQEPRHRPSACDVRQRLEARRAPQTIY